ALAATLLVEQRARPHGWLAHWSSTGAMERPIALRVAGDTFGLALVRMGPGRWQAWQPDDRQAALQIALHGPGRAGIGGLEHRFDAVVGERDGHLDAFGYSGGFAD